MGIDSLTGIGNFSSLRLDSQIFKTKSDKTYLVFDKYQKVTKNPLTETDGTKQFSTFAIMPASENGKSPLTETDDTKQFSTSAATQASESGKSSTTETKTVSTEKDPSYDPKTSVEHEDSAPYDEELKKFGITEESWEKTSKDYNVEQHNKNNILKNTKASNGLTYTEAKYIFMTLYEKYIDKCKLSCPKVWNSTDPDHPGKAFGGAVGDVDPSIIESKMDVADREMYQKAKAAIEELEQKHPEVVKAYVGSKCAKEEAKFKWRHICEGNAYAAWVELCQESGTDPNTAVYR